MTTEDDFHAALDAHPEDWQCRLVFADWLEERGDQRAEGYRALGRSRCAPAKFRSFWGYHPGSIKRELRDQWLPHDWFYARSQWCSYFRGHPSRRTAEDAAALAFAQLPAERRAELLNPNPVGAA